MQQVTARRLDGRQFQTMVSQDELDQETAVVQQAGQEVVIICEKGGTWHEVPRHSRGDQVTYSFGGQSEHGEVIHVLEATSSDPLVYILLPEGCRVPTVATPREVIEPER